MALRSIFPTTLKLMFTEAVEGRKTSPWGSVGVGLSSVAGLLSGLGASGLCLGSLLGSLLTSLLGSRFGSSFCGAEGSAFFSGSG